MEAWRNILKANPTAWLLEADNPSVRYLTLRHVLGRPEDDAEVKAAREAIRTSRVVKRIFARQEAGGFWLDPTKPYLPKYKASYWTLMLLGHLGVSREDARVEQAVEYIFRFQRAEGGFAEAGEEEARRQYLRRAEKDRERGKVTPDESSFIADYLHQAILSCLTGNVIAALLRMGYGEDPRLWLSVDWLVEIQNPDGGWLCPYWKAHVKDTHSCFYGTICALEAFSEIPESQRPPRVQEAVARAAEFLLRHRLYKADHHDYQVINPAWLKLAFPWFYGYSILRGLWVLARLDYQDERMTDALEVLREKQTSDGKWILESTPYGRMQANLEKKGRPSKWVTLMAVWALRDRLMIAT